MQVADDYLCFCTAHPHKSAIVNHELPVQSGQLPSLIEITILPGGLVPDWLYGFPVPTLVIQDWPDWELNCSCSNNARLLCQTLRLSLPTYLPQVASLSHLLMFPPTLKRLELAAGAPDAAPALPILLKGSVAEVDEAVRRWGSSLQPVWLQDGTWVPGVGPVPGGDGVQPMHPPGDVPSQPGDLQVQQVVAAFKEVLQDQDVVMAEAGGQLTQHSA